MKTSVSISRFSAICILLTASAACTQKIEYVTPDWVRLIFPEENGTVAIDFFQPDETQVFRWEQRENATYKVSFDLNMHFENARTFDVGAIDSLVFTNSDLLEMLRDIDPDFSGSRRFFWKVEQNMDGNIRSSWRYFNAMPLVESFTDSRDGEVYGACQFVLDDGTLMTIMSENLRATEYSDDSSASSAGSLGWMDVNTNFVESFKEAALALEEGEVSDWVVSEYGYHLIKCDESTYETLSQDSDFVSNVLTSDVSIKPKAVWAKAQELGVDFNGNSDLEAQLKQYMLLDEEGN